MNHTRSAVAALVVLTLFVGMGTAVPTDSVHDQSQAGPPSDLPESVPDFVGDVLNTIQQFVDGVLDGILGPAVSEESGANTTTADADGG